MDYEIEKEWMSSGLKCKVVLVHGGSHRCGYVGVEKGNPAWELGYDDVPIRVHGGLTFADHKLGQSKTPELYWLGFDCAHSGDETRYLGAAHHTNDHWWTLEEVIAETNDMAKQLAEITWNNIVERKLEYMPDWFKERVRIIAKD